MDGEMVPSVFTESFGRIKISALLFHMGADLQIVLYGGGAHLGAMALASPNEKPLSLSVPGHKDFMPAEEMAAKISASLGRRVGVSCGINFKDITQEEIGRTLALCRAIADRIISSLSDV